MTLLILSGQMVAETLESEALLGPMADDSPKLSMALCVAALKVGETLEALQLLVLAFLVAMGS